MKSINKCEVKYCINRKINVQSIISAILVFVIIFIDLQALMVNETKAAGVDKEIVNNIQTDYYNIKSIGVDVYGKCKTSFISSNSQGYQIVVYKDKVYIEQYDKLWNKLWDKIIELELPLWGGYYCGSDYNFIVCGQRRDNNVDNGGEVYRIIKYDKNFNKIDACSLNSNETYTITPFNSGEVSIDENENDLIIYTSRLRLDGHQSNIKIILDKNNMTLKDKRGILSFPDVHVSHSFRQIVKYDNENPVFVDLCDAYPERSIYLQSSYVNISMLDIEGEVGDNVTGADLTGIGISDSTYIVTGTYLFNGVNNVFISYVDKNKTEGEGQWLTFNNIYNSDVSYSPRIVKVSDNRFVVMWGNANSVSYIIIDKYTNSVSGLKKVAGSVITDCEPIYADGKIMWITYANGKMIVNEISDFSETGSYSPIKELTSSHDEWNGQADTSWYSDDNSEFHINNPQQLAGLAEIVNNGNTFLGKKIYLDNDIYMNKTDALNKIEWIPIAYSESNSIDESDSQIEFDGLFDGNGHNIYNIYVPSNSNYKGGLFGKIGEKGKVQYVSINQSLMLQNCSICLENDGKIIGCTNNSYVYGDDERVGGICKYNNGNIWGCQNKGRINGENVAGIANHNKGIIIQCNNKGFVLGGPYEPGGIVQLNNGYIENCYNSGVVSDNIGINAGRWAAGIVSSDNGYLKTYNCYNNGIIDINRGGLYYGAYNISFNQTDNRKCFATTDIYDNINTQVISDKDELLSALNKDMKIQDMWYEDEWDINSGMPITMPEYYMQKGVKPYEGINIEDNILYGMLSGTKVKDLTYKLLGDANIKNDDGNILSENDIITTGNKVKVTTKDNTFNEYIISIKGDVDGSGTIDVLDMEAIQKSILGIGSELTGAYKKAALLSGDSKEISVLDMEAIQKDILGVEKIK